MSENNDARGAWYQLVIERLKDLRDDLVQSEQRFEVKCKDVDAKIEKVDDKVTRLEQELTKIKAQAALIGAAVAFIIHEALKWAREHLN